jgi:hypothetical protein
VKRETANVKKEVRGMKYEVKTKVGSTKFSNFILPTSYFVPAGRQASVITA